MNATFRGWAATLAVSVAILAGGCERPPVDTVQRGYRGLGMVEMYNPRVVSKQVAVNQAPEPVAAAQPGGPLATSAYQNVQVLKDLNVGEFTRLMIAITNWVAPQQGCVYCHAGSDLASDALYTKVVARRMLQMTRHINTTWKNHVAATGVTCFTCHRGQPVPANIWFTNPGPAHARGISADRAGQNIAAPRIGLTSLPYDPFTAFLEQKNEIRTVSTTALPAGNRHSIKQTEWTYALMMHISQSLGVNCTYCHNSRSFFAWDASTPQRATAWYGIRLVRELNVSYLEPLKSQFPPTRLGPLGDVPKVNCATCHQGAYKPLYGASMLKDYPVLGVTGAAKSSSQ
jgi:photosynthetic reaction center cytochrome c subunit